MRPLPIRLSLTVWYCMMFAAAAILLSLTSWWMLQRSLSATEYYELQERAEDVEILLKQYGPNATPEQLQKSFNEIYRIKDDGKYLQICDENGNWIYRSTRMKEWGIAPPRADSLPQEGQSSTIHHGTRNIKVLAYRLVVAGKRYTVQAGLSLRRSRELLTSFGTKLILLTPAVLIVAAIGGHLMSRKALDPVMVIASEARRINDRNLDIRLPITPVKDEISHLSETLNHMLERVELGVRSMREFTANAAHELRTPLALIRTEVEVALSLPRTSDEYREACEQVQQETVRMSGLIDSLLMLARIDAGIAPLRFEAVDASELVRKLGERWTSTMTMSLLSFQVDIGKPAAFVMADAESLDRLLTILVDNAVRYTSCGSVNLRVNQIGREVVFAVRDTGLGIAPEHHAMVFDRFYRVSRMRTNAYGGSGLGLSLAKWIAEAHSTEIKLDSKAGQGSCFYFSLPACS